jgi:hypothetical protein
VLQDQSHGADGGLIVIGGQHPLADVFTAQGKTGALLRISGKNQGDVLSSAAVRGSPMPNPLNVAP